jgi:WD40 repeat protein
MHVALSLLLLSGLDAREGLTIKLPEPVCCLTFNPDGKQLAGSVGGTVKVWNATNGRQILRVIPSHEAAVSSVAFSRDGKRLVTHTADGTTQT